MTPDRGLLTAPGGLVPLPQYYQDDGIRPNYVAPRWRNRTWRGRLRNFFAWDAGWGFPLQGGSLCTFVPLADLVPAVNVSRGGVRFALPSEGTYDA